MVRTIEILSLLCLIGVTFYGICTLFVKSVPLYFKLSMCAVICAVMELVYDELLWSLAAEGYVTVNLGVLGACGFYFFVLAANYGVFDSIVDGGRPEYKWARRISWIMPVILLPTMIYNTIAENALSPIYLLISVIIVIGLLPCTYYNLKIILMRDDGTHFVRGAKPMNTAALVYILLPFIDGYIGSDSLEIASLLSIGINLSLIAMVFCINWGVKQWIS